VRCFPPSATQRSRRLMPARHAADRPGSSHHVDATSHRIGTRAARTVPRAPWRPRAPRRAGSHGLSIFQSRKIPPLDTDRLPFGRRCNPRRGRPRTWHGHDLGRRRPDLGRFPDRRGARRRLAHVAPDGGDALRDTELHRARHIAARLSAPQGGAGPAAIDDSRDIAAPAATEPAGAGQA